MNATSKLMETNEDSGELGDTRPLKSNRRASWSEDLEVVHNVWDTHYRRSCFNRNRASVLLLVVLLIVAMVIGAVAALLTWKRT